MSLSPDTIVDLNLGIRPEAAVSGGMLVQTDQSTFLTFNAMQPTERMSPHGGPYMENAGTALFEFQRCLLTRFGYPNDEARWGIPRFEKVSYGIYEVRNSTWIKEVIQMNRYRFPNTTDDYVSNHYLFAFHDSTFECLANGFKHEVIQESFEIVLRRITERVAME
jgi:hypothetical protein